MYGCSAKRMSSHTLPKFESELALRLAIVLRAPSKNVLTKWCPVTTFTKQKVITNGVEDDDQKSDHNISSSC